MSEEASFQPRVRGLQVRIWLTNLIIFIIGVLIGLAAWVVSGRLQINWDWSGWATLLGLATLVGILATAIGTVALASSTQVMAESAQRQAKSTSDSVALQREELEVVKGQLELTRQQLRLAREEFNAARSADRAKLQVDAGFAQPTAIMGAVKYVAGREAAYDIEVWGRSWAGYSGGKIPAVLTPQGQYGFTISSDEALGPLDEEAMARWPFPDVLELPPLAENESWVGVTWRTHDDYRGRQLNHVPPGQQREYHPPVLEPGPSTDDRARRG